MELGKWRGLFDWSMKFQDGTHPVDYQHVQEFTPERRKWLEDALKHYMQDFVDRMKEIKEVFDREGQGVDQPGEQQQESTSESLKEKELLLDELNDIVSSIDYARDLHKIGGLPTLLKLLHCNHPSLRWRAAEVVSTCVQNNPPVQDWFLEGGVMPPLVALLEDGNNTCVTKGLLGVSSLVRHNDPALEAFLKTGSLDGVMELVTRDDVRLQRKALALLQYILAKKPECRCQACSAGVPDQLAALLEQPSSELRQASLAVLLELSRTESCWERLRKVEGLSAKVQSLLNTHQALPSEDREAEREEGDLLQELGKALNAEEWKGDGDEGVLRDHISGAADPFHAAPLSLGLSTRGGPRADSKTPQGEEEGSYGANLALMARPLLDPQ